MLISVVVLLVSTIGFVGTKRRIDSDNEIPWRNTTSDVLFGVSLTAIAAVIALLMIHVIGD